MVRRCFRQDLPMLASFRRSLTKWPARIFFLLLACAFGLWGVSGKMNLGGDRAPATVGGRKIQLPELQEAYRRELAQTTRMMGTTDPSPDIRRMVAMQATERLVTQAALQEAARGLGVAVPDEAVRQAVFDVPAFRGQNGQFDRATMTTVLRNNGLNEQRFLEIMRTELSQRQVLEALRAGSAAPDVMAREVFAIQQEKRVADTVEVPLAAAAPPPAPTDAQLERWWANHPEQYSSPEYRRISAVVLATETLAKDIQVSEDELKTSWEQHKAEFNKPERRSVQVILTQDEAQAQALAARWGAGADWSTMQAEADRLRAAPVELSDATRLEFPAPELGDAVFATPEGVVPPPVHSALGWHVLKVTKVSGGVAQSLDEARDAARARVVTEKAADLMYDRANRIENLLSSGTPLDHLPGDVDAAAVTGTLDAQGMTPAGTPAPIPGPAELRPALVQAAFAAKVGDQPKLVQAPNAANGEQSFFAFAVEQITQPAPRPFADVAERVRADWTADQVRHEQETVAATLLANVKGGQSLADAARPVNYAVRRLPPAGRASSTPNVPSELVEPLFALKQGEATMLETPDGFMVAVLAEIQQPDPKSDPVGFGQVKAALAKSLGEDIQAAYAVAVRDRAQPRIDQAAVASLYSTPAE
jgi:peptidyl-prolyl cis-trans isomerase D